MGDADSGGRTVGETLADGVAAVVTRLSSVTGDDANAVVEYHSVGDPGRYDDVPTERFRRDLAYLDDRYEVVDLPAVVADATGGKKVALTFDDGLANFYENAYPALRAFDAPATLFVNAGLVGGRNPDLLDRYRARPAELGDGEPPGPPVEPGDLLTEAQLRELADDDRVTVGNHSLRHADLSAITDEDELREEVVGGKERLEAMVDAPVERFCYPYGRRSAESAALVAETHDLAVVSDPGLVAPTADRHALPRVSVQSNETRFRCTLTSLCWRVKRVQARVGDRLG